MEPEICVYCRGRGCDTAECFVVTAAELRESVCEAWDDLHLTPGDFEHVDALPTVCRRLDLHVPTTVQVVPWHVAPIQTYDYAQMGESVFRYISTALRPEMYRRALRDYTRNPAAWRRRHHGMTFARFWLLLRDTVESAAQHDTS